jgi:hypothetical protein
MRVRGRGAEYAEDAEIYGFSKCHITFCFAALSASAVRSFGLAS